MQIPRLRGVIERRVLVNYRLDPRVAERALPAPFRPMLHDGAAMAGICLIRLGRVRPEGVCDWVGLRSENAAHRFAVTFETAGRPQSGVYVPRRDTDSRLNRWAGGRIFPGEQNLADFDCREEGDTYRIALESRDGKTQLSVAGTLAKALPKTSVFSSLDEASRFFESGSLGYSATGEPGVYHGLELACDGWRVEALDVQEVYSSYFENSPEFPEGSVVFDHALLMRDIQHEWVGHPDLCCAAAR
ncbi:MAG: DUF2071 domain-containing protein [Myxococcota bacterium]